MDRGYPGGSGDQVQACITQRLPSGNSARARRHLDVVHDLALAQLGPHLSDLPGFHYTEDQCVQRYIVHACDRTRLARRAQVDLPRQFTEAL